MSVAGIVSSPPFAASLNDGIVDDRWKSWARNPDGSNRLARSMSQNYGSSAGQLGAFPLVALPEHMGGLMTLPEVEVLTWEGCYNDSWKSLIVQSAYSHPAKYAR